LLTALKGIQLGTIEDAFGWCERVVEPAGYVFAGEERGKGEVNGVAMNGIKNGAGNLVDSLA
jgi:hypothetical protein